MIEFTWVQVYEARFGKRLSEDEVAVWESEIQNDIRSLRPGELIDAIRAIAEEDRKGGGNKRKFAPDCQTIVSAIIRTRYQAKAEQEKAAPSCALCNDGWIPFGFVASLDGPTRVCGFNGTVTDVDAQYAMLMSTFCKCAKGQKRKTVAVYAGRTDEHLSKELQDLVWAARFKMSGVQ